MKDLDKAIELSKGQGRSGIQAFCQRGLLKRRQGDIKAAREDFSRAAHLGSHFAKQQVFINK
jgi:hypothetical protein